MIRTLDAAGLVCVAASAAGADADDLVVRCDVAVLTAIAGRAAVAASVVDAAAETMVGVAASRPFPVGNEVAAWLAAAHVFSLNRMVVMGSEDDVVALVRNAARGDADERAVAAALAGLVRPDPSRMARLGRWLFKVKPGAASVRLLSQACPVCGREVVIPVFRGPNAGLPTVGDRVAVCARHHRTHRRDGAPLPGRPAGDEPPLVALASELDRLRAQLALL